MRLGLILCCLATSVQADGVSVLFQDGNPTDSLWVWNQGCPLIDATLTLNFETSAGKIVIDSDFPPPGTRDPAPVTVVTGNVSLQNVEDGDTDLSVDVTLLGTNETFIVTMDVDDQVDLREDDRVFADGNEVAGTTATLVVNGVTAVGRLDRNGRTVLDLPNDAGICPLS